MTTPCSELRTCFEAGQPLTNEVLYHYEDLSRNAWRLLGRAEEDDDDRAGEIGYDEFASALECLGFVVFDGRLSELFSACCAHSNGERIDRTDFDIALMVNDVVEEEKDCRPTLREAFDAFDVDGVGRLSLSQYLEACRSLGYDDDNQGRGNGAAARLPGYFFRATHGKDGGRLEYEEFVKIWCDKLSDAVVELQKREPIDTKKGSSLVIAICRPLLKRNARRQLYKEMLRTDDPTSLSSRFADARQKIVDMRDAARRSNDKVKRKRAAKKQRRGRAAATSSSRLAKLRRSSVQNEEDRQSELEQSNDRTTRNVEAEEELAKRRTDEAIRRSREEAKERELSLLRRANDKLSLINANLSSVPLSLYDGEAKESLFSIVVLDLSGNKLTSLPVAFSFHLVSLRKLRLSGNRLANLVPLELRGMQQLQILEADNNALESLPMDCLPSSLLHLDVSRNKLTSVSGLCDAGGNAPTPLRSLVSFIARSNLIAQLPDAFGELSSLEVLDLSDNELSALPESFSRLSHLVKADLHSNSINDLPMGCNQLLSLEVLDLSSNSIQELPTSFTDLAKLAILTVGNNRLLTLPSHICGCGKVLSLDLSDNDISDVSSDIGKLTFLQKLVLRGNKIAILPKEVGLLTDCIRLNLRNNVLRALPVEIGAIKSLRRADLSYNDLKELPSSFCLLANLTYLDLSRNRLQCLPDQIGALFRLDFLDVSHNFIEQIPPSGKDLASLKVLAANSNRIDAFGDDILEGLTALERLDVCSNRLSTMPLRLTERISNDGLAVDIGNNPFDLLLQKSVSVKGKGKQAFELVDNLTAVSWLTEESALYSSAVSQWRAAAASNDCYSVPPSSSEQFTESIRRSMGYDEEDVRWKDMFLLYLRVFFYESRSCGGDARNDDSPPPPCHNRLKEKVLRDRERDRIITQARRTADAQKAKEDDLEEQRRLHEVYFLDDLESKMDLAFEVFDKRSEEMKSSEMNQLRCALVEEAKVQEVRVAELAEERRSRYDDEVEALTSLVGCTAPGATNITSKRTLPVELEPCWKT